MSLLSNPSDRKTDHKIRLILGCGYVGERIAKRWLEAGDRVLALSRSPERATALAAVGIEPIVRNWLDPLMSEPMQQDTWLQSPPDTVLVSVSHAAPSHARGLSNLASCLKGAVRKTRWIYLSTTGVFADPAPESSLWVDESSPTLPARPGSVNALEAERWLEDSDLEHVILRPAGIYGPGRIPNVQAIRESQSMPVDPESYLNLIHVEDLSQIIATVSDRPLFHRLYCVSDGKSIVRREYYAFIARLLNLPEPKYSDTLNPQYQRRRNQGNKRVSNRRLLNDHPIVFRYPDYRSGLSSMLEEFS
jgi:nucleoside-diphosphate-sugar epimerase